MYPLLQIVSRRPSTKKGGTYHGKPGVPKIPRKKRVFGVGGSGDKTCGCSPAVTGFPQLEIIATFGLQTGQRKDPCLKPAQNLVVRFWCYPFGGPQYWVHHFEKPHAKFWEPPSYPSFPDTLTGKLHLTATTPIFCSQIYIYIHTHTYICVYTYIYIYTLDIYIYTDTDIDMDMCMYACLQTVYMHTYGCVVF